MPEHDVLIVGAGPAGLLLACLLVQEGLDAVVCERRIGSDARTRAIGIHRPGLDALDAAGVGGAVRGEALRLEGGEVRSRGRTLAALEFSTSRPVLTLPQPRTSALLHERLSSLAPEALRSGWAVRSLREEGEAVRVIVDAAGLEHEITVGAVVVADGIRSRLREQLGATWRRRPGRAEYAMIDVDDPSPTATAVVHCEPAGLVESLPMPGGRRRWVARQQTGAPLDTSAAFRAAVEDRTGIRLDLDAAAQPAVFHAGQRLAFPLHWGRVVLLGDAAHEVSPIGGQGMNLAWADAVRLAGVLTGGLPWRPDFTRYARQVRRSARIAHRRSAFYMAMGAPAPAAAIPAREALIRSLGSAPLRKWTSGLITMRGL